MEKYQTVWRRIGAAFLDSLILMPVSWVVSFFFVLIGSSPISVIVSSALIGFISVFYYILMHSYYGQTLGKMVTKVKVLDDSETKINFGQAVLRSLPQLIPVMYAVSSSTAGGAASDSIAFWASIIYGLMGLFLIADIIVCLANEKHQALHDFIAGTIVIRTDV